ncbi:PREDICTED: beta-galactosidase 11 [Brassica oleracea var. oleracea]|uniref:Beta-galactosidase n=1 Tax=Brassica oleracea var. oleracea TaxID=109376 RepID=A0A0D3DHR8_BRAOL|nr:PREDICTED: beta-galactosidase 11 [Brassica oleracea var. oleracea]XP_013598158.1 PREDICTED: beta-galactosidase 11 [Brassica oleracea var. oleracea]
MRKPSLDRWVLAAFLVVLLSSSCAFASKKEVKKKTNNKEVTYDGTSLIIDGKRELLYSGSIHYPRSTPEMWPSIIERAKQGGLNTIQTYVFWNVHELEQGKFNFSGRTDLVKFIKLIEKNGMYVTLRLGPFIQAEWTHGGLPYWLREVPGIFFRTDNKEFKEHTERYVRTVLDKMKEEKLFASQGGPIILGQIENEYSAVQRAYKQDGINYIKWASKLVDSMKLGIPWVMCKHNDAPDPMINACNGRHCGDTFPGPNKENKPSLWTENWTTQFRVFGDSPVKRSVEDIAFSVARFFSKNGTHVNYYMYHGGTNFGRNGAHYVTTRYYDDAPLDEYGLEREPKYGHLKHLHNALNLCKKPLLWGQPRTEKPGKDTEIRYYEEPGTKSCAAFLANNNTEAAETIKFRGKEYVIAPRSISILPDCKTVVYNTAQIVSHHTSRNFMKSKKANKKFDFNVFTEPLPNKLKGDSYIPVELYGLTKDKTDYGWYTTSFKINKNQLPKKKGAKTTVRIASLGHALHAWFNGEYLGNGHGSHDEKSFVFQEPVTLKEGENHLVMLGVLTGFPDSGAFLEHRYTGPRSVSILGLSSGVLDLTESSKWGNKVGMEGERLGIHTEEGLKKVKWQKFTGKAPGLTWYQTYFDAPESESAAAVRMSGMGKGLIWVNGEGVGRYWMSFLNPLGQSTQIEYHIPRSFLKPKKNLLVIFEEEPNVKPEIIDFVIVNRDTVCSYVGEDYTPSVRHWTRKQDQVQAITDNVSLTATLKCSGNKKISEVEFASFGNPIGTCGNFTLGTCNAPVSKQVIEKHCLGKGECVIPVNKSTFQQDKKDSCKNVVKTLAVQVKCARDKKN